MTWWRPASCAITASAWRRSKKRSKRSSTRTLRRCRSSSICSGNGRQQLFLPRARQQKVGILARVPLASGLLTGKMTRQTSFAADDHRNFNRHGEAFDVGETFAGVPYEVGLEAVEELRRMVPAGASMAQLALRWILMFDAITCAIPGAKRPAQAEDNVAAADLPPLSDEQMATVRAGLRSPDPAARTPALVGVKIMKGSGVYCWYAPQTVPILSPSRLSWAALFFEVVLPQRNQVVVNPIRRRLHGGEILGRAHACQHGDRAQAGALATERYRFLAGRRSPQYGRRACPAGARYGGKCPVKAYRIQSARRRWQPPARPPATRPPGPIPGAWAKCDRYSWRRMERLGSRPALPLAACHRSYGGPCRRPPRRPDGGRP